MANFLDTLDSFNILCRIDGLAGRIRKHGGVRFEIDRRGGMTGIDIERYLKQYSVNVFGRGFNAETADKPPTLYFSVGPRQARWCEYLLARRGVSVVSSAVDEQSATRAQALNRSGAPTPTPWSSSSGRRRKQSGLLDRVLSLLD